MAKIFNEFKNLKKILRWKVIISIVLFIASLTQACFFH